MSSPLPSHFSSDVLEDGKSNTLGPHSPRSHSSQSSHSSPPTSPDSPKSSGVLLQEPRRRFAASQGPLSQFRPSQLYPRNLSPGQLLPGQHLAASKDRRDMPLALAREGGVVTQLIPADELPFDLVGVPRVQASEGVWIVAVRERGAGYAMAPQGGRANTRALTAAGGVDMQNRIDEIISTTPIRRPKIYCDKWIHEGTCAFTQQGCRFKHEMPLDRATQNSLGLQGLPQWFKNNQAVKLRAINDAPESLSRENVACAVSAVRRVGREGNGIGGGVDGVGSQGAWRRRDGVSGSGLSNSFEHECALRSGNVAGMGGFKGEQNRLASRFGPIAPPSSRASSAGGAANPFAMLSTFDLSDERDDK